MAITDAVYPNNHNGNVNRFLLPAVNTQVLTLADIQRDVVFLSTVCQDPHLSPVGHVVGVNDGV